MIIKPVARGLLTYIPGFYNLFSKRKKIDNVSAEYFYGLWIKHLTMLFQNGMKTIPESVAEIGPGSSIGLGLAALLSGANKYCAFDVVDHTDLKSNLKIFDQLVEYFKIKKGVKTGGWPDYYKYLDPNGFPSHILTDEILEKTLSEDRISEIRNILLNKESQTGIEIKYIAPWVNYNKLKKCVDLVISHSVLEHVNDLKNTYKAMSKWLKQDGFISHQIDFRSHKTTNTWNGHWQISDALWKLIVGKRPFLINRQPCSKHIELIKNNRFEILCSLKNIRDDGIYRQQLARDFQHINDEDLNTSGWFVQAMLKV
ncbi:MAG: hypothetical protein H8E98_06545 [Bacteroidetes bacterium]|nr:hypothetical protein [Bacteroidota bacterium]